MKKIISYLEEVNILYLYVIIIVLIILTGTFMTLFMTKKQVINQIVPLEENKIEEVETTEEIKKVKVDIKGNVQTPGVYELDEGSRVIDAINLAGGLLENSDTSLINLSKTLTDEMTVIIYTKEEIANYKASKTQIEYVYIEVEKCPDIVNDACINQEDNIKEETITNEETTSSDKIEDKDKATLISINTATIEQFDSLPGIGEAKAKSIVEYRDKNGLFETVEDIKNVSGIGESLFEKIKDYITV